MTIWIAFTVLLLLAIGFVALPLFRGANNLTALLAGVIVFVVASSAGLYYRIGSPDVPSGAPDATNIDDMVVALAARLEENPDDLNGWHMLARTYQTLKRYPEAVAAFDRILELEQNGNAQSFVAYAITLMERDGGAISRQASTLLENALALDPTDPNALFYSGAAAASRGEVLLAADRWEQLLAVNPPDEIRNLLVQRIAEWRGEEPPAATPTVQGGAIVAARVSIADAAELPPNATVFIIARDPEQPSPPIAVARRQVQELPSVVEMGDRDSMVPGRSLSNFARFELVARVSLSGSPTAQPGDWYGSLVFERGQDPDVELLIDREVKAE